MSIISTHPANLRIAFFKNALGAKASLHQAFEKIYNAEKGDWLAIENALQKNKSFSKEMVNNLSFTNALANWTGDNKVLVSHFQHNKETNSLRDIAVGFSKNDLKKIVKGTAIPKGQTKDEYVDSLYNKLHENEPTAVIVNMIKDPKVPLLNTASGKFIADLLSNNPKFNIRTTSVYELINKNKFFKDLPEAQVSEIKNDIKSLQRITVLSPAPEAIPALINKKYTSALAITQLPPKQFIESMDGSGLPKETLAHIYTEAENRKIINEQALIKIKEAGERTGISIIDGDIAVSGRHTPAGIPPDVKDVIVKNNLSWDLLFGDADFCECGECTSVYSAAAYYVDLLQYLRNNNIDKDYVKIDPTDLRGTPLENLFARRPDLGRLELTCKNTNTILPYVDLVDEVMEQYVAFQTTKAFNVAEETSGELLSAPQHTEQTAAYQKLSETFFPFTLPYHQPIDATRIFLDHLGSSRFELMDTFYSARDLVNAMEPTKQGGALTSLPITYNQSLFEMSTLDKLYAEYLQRAVEAEFLNLTAQEYYALTKEVFISKEYWETQFFVGGSHGIHTVAEYQNKIGLIPVAQFYGYTGAAALADMLSIDETKQLGLTFVKKQLLLRTGIEYDELIELLKTQYINPPKQSGGITVVGDEVGLFNTDKCDLDEVRLKMGIPQYAEKRYDRMHRFIRLWRKLGFTIDETDKVIMFLGDGEITPGLIRQLVAVKKIMSLTGIEITKLLCFWGDIGTVGESSLYKRLFLTHNLLAMDAVFKPVNGLYLNAAGTIKDHLPAVMAALNLSADDILAINEFKSLPADVTMTVTHLSLLYRYRLLSKTLGLRIRPFIKLLEVFGNVFENADTTLRFLENLNKVEQAGFNGDQLSYIITGADNTTKPLAPSKKEVIVVAKKIYDGIQDIEFEHADLATDISATTELVRNKASILYDAEMVEKIIELVSVDNTFGTTVLKGLDFTLPTGISYVLSYVKDTGLLQITGEPNSIEIAALKLLKDNQATPQLLGAEWILGIDNIVNQQNSVRNNKQANKAIFDLVLSGIFARAVSPTPAEAEKYIVGDDLLKTSYSKKCFTFLQVFLPYLREQLKNKLIVTSLAEQTGLHKNIAQCLASDILKIGNNSLYTILASLEDLFSATPSTDSWYGKLIPLTDADYTFEVKAESDKKFSISLNGLVIINHPASPVNPATTIELAAAEMKLAAGKVYQFSAEGINLDNIFWKTKTTAFEHISVKALLPDFKKKESRFALELFKKMTVLINTLSLSADELEYFHGNASDFDDIDFNHIHLQPLLRIIDYCNLRNSLPVAKINVLQFWQRINESTIVLSDHIADLTHWKKEYIENLISHVHFNLSKSGFKNERALIQLQKAMHVRDKLGFDVESLFEWAVPAADFQKCKDTADSIQKVIRAQYNQTDWEQVVKPLNDRLRNNQKNALIAYLLQQVELQKAGLTDAGGLFEYFLIDVQMDTCMETSRIKQAISSVQLFVQRCILGLEKGIAPDRLDRNRWEWMQRYRVWEANRKVFLYPENWIEGNLRDDKSPFFKELESELLQKDINKQSVEDALKAYLYKVDEVANMEVVGVHIETAIYMENGQSIEKAKKLHVFSRTRNAPYFFYYRYLDIPSRNWYPWEKMQVDIPSYDIEVVTEVIKAGSTYNLNPKYKTIIGNGCYLTPIIWNNRLLIFFPQFMRKTKPNENDAGAKSFTDISEDPIDSVKQLEYWEIKLACSEYRNEKWTQKQLSKDAIYDIPGVDEFWDVFNEASKIKGRSVAAQKDYDLKYQTAWRKRDKWLTAQKALNDTQQWNNGSGPGSDAEFAEWEVRRDAEQNTYDIYQKAWGKEKEALDIKDDTAAEAAMNPAVKLLATLQPPAPAHDISKYEFVPAISANNQLIINIYYNNALTVTGAFEFDGANIKASLTPHSKNNAVTIDKFHHGGGGIQSLQLNNAAGDHRFGDVVSTTYHTGNSYINFYHTESHNLLGILHTQSLESFFKYPLTTIAALQKLPYANLTVKEFKDDIFGGYVYDKNTQTPNSYHELKRSYSIYNWELFFHTPMMLADALSKSQQFEEAMKWFHYIFNPIADGPGNDVKRFWQFTPFKEIDSKSILEAIFDDLKGNRADEAISEWRDNPFKPHLVARNRPVAYMKWVVMKYIDNILDWGDYLFRQDTIESINQATQLYVLAGHILGTKPTSIPKRGKSTPQTYLSLLSKWDAFSNAISELEVVTVYPAGAIPTGISTVGTAATPDLFGSAGSLYFCIPKNPKLMGYWDTIADRLFKIRHCQNIEGVFRKLPLFEPPIDPALLVKAAAQGLSISSVVNDLNSSMPNYRFYYLLQKALELCNELKSLGAAMLSAIEKKDNEAISLIRARHEGNMNNLVMEIKKLQLEEAQKSLVSLQQNRKAPEARMKYYLELTGEDANKLPTTDGDFTELTNSIEKPIDESGLRLSKFEKEDVDKAHAAKDWQIAIGVIETLASIAHVIPTIGVNATPLGIGGDVKWGGTHLGNALQAVGKGFQIGANILTYESTNAAKKGGFQRSLQERLMQANAAGYELKQIDKQITAQQIRIDIANTEINNQKIQMDNANEVEEFLKNKYTNEELYTWMRGSLKTLYRQVYNLAYDLAKKAEKTYCFERGISNANFIQTGYFDAGREGLLAGEQLYVGLKQLEAAHQEKRGYDYEITKHISLRQLDPLALLQLKTGSKCEFELPEVLFDMDYSGHFKRRIKSVSISIPCITGPYTSVNATLRILNNKFRNSSIANNYPEKTDEQDDRFISYNIPIMAIATSSAQNDAGTFELNFKDERYLPFEGAGAISRWKLELPTVKQFDYSTITDVVLHVKYIATDGGEQLKNSAVTSVRNYMRAAADFSQQGGLFALIDMKHDMPGEWNLFVKNGTTNITIDKSRLSYLAQSMNIGSAMIIFVSRKQISRLKTTCLNPATVINFNAMPGTGLLESQSLEITIGTQFEIYGFKTIPATASSDAKEVVDNTELISLDDLVMVVKYSF